MVKDVDQLPGSLKKAMEDKGISASELARECGVSMASLSRILSGQVNPSFSNMAKIAKALGISLDALGGTDNQPQLKAIDTTKSKSATSHLDYSKESEILVTFVLENTDYSPLDAAKLISSAAAGTWVDCWTDQLVDKDATPRARAVNYQKVGTRRVSVDIAFPHDLVEAGSISSLLSVVTAAITSTGAKISDMRIPPVLVRTFNGPAFGINGLRDLTNKFGRPLLSATMRPMVGLSPRMYGRAIAEALRGGVDMTCDPTLLHSPPTNTWKERFRFAAEAVQASINDTNEVKFHAANISAATVDQMIERAEYAKDLGLNSVMLESASVGFSAVQQMAEWCADNDVFLCAMGGRALTANALTEHLSAKLLRFAGCDVVSTGSPLRGGTINRRQVKGVSTLLTSTNPDSVTEAGIMFDQPTFGCKGSFPACGGGHNPWHFPRLLDAMGDDFIIQCGGSVMGHPWGSAAGATANRVAIEALVQARNEGDNLHVNGRNILQRAMRHSSELKAALDYWQEGAFLFGVILGDGDDKKKSPISAVVTNTDKPTPTQPKGDK